MHETLKTGVLTKELMFGSKNLPNNIIFCLLGLEKVQGPEDWVGLVGGVWEYKKCIRYRHRAQTFLFRENHLKFQNKKNDIVYRYYRIPATPENNCDLGVVHVPGGLSHLLHEQLCLPWAVLSKEDPVSNESFVNWCRQNKCLKRLSMDFRERCILKIWQFFSVKELCHEIGFKYFDKNVKYRPK